MPRQMMMENLIESESRGISSRSVMTKLISAGIQVGVIALMIVIPLLATDVMPEPPEVMMAFMAPPPPPPPPPLPPAAARAKPVESAKAPVPRPLPTSDFVAPVAVPTEIPAEDFGLASASLGAVDAGVPGGALGGVEGGMPGAPAEEPIRVGGEVQAPKKLKDVPPEYPTMARNARIEGTVILEAVIDSRGIVADVRVLKSIPLLDDAAVEAVKQWRYQATLLNGQAVPVVMTVTVNFGLEKA